MLNWFRKKNVVSENPIRTDIHSHLLPGLDDGVQSFEDAEEIILRFIKAGYKKLITTPHIMSDAYRNTPEGIRARLAELKEYLKSKNIGIEIEAAAEYYLDEVFIKHVETDQELLTFGKRLLLFETNFMTEPLQLKEFIFMATTKDINWCWHTLSVIYSCRTIWQKPKTSLTVAFIFRLTHRH